MSQRWMVHLKDGRTLTERDCFPHEVEDYGVAQDDITSVERVVEGKILTIKKSDLIDGFFIATEEFIDMKMSPGAQAPPVVTKRMIGCYVKDTEPPLQCRLTMDPRTFDATLEFFRVTAKAKAGINADRAIPLKKGVIVPMYTLPMGDNFYHIVQNPEIAEIFPTVNGMGCILTKPKIRAEILVKNQNVLLAFMMPGQRLLIEEEKTVTLNVNMKIPSSKSPPS